MNKNKNILFITSDQQHFMTQGLLNPEVKTPNLDRLAAMGTMFTRGYTVNPTCTPTRATFITGLYPSQHGAYSLGTKLPEDVPTVGDYLQKAGYKTTLIGKAHFQPLLDHPKYRSVESNPLQQNLEFWRNFTDVDFYGFTHIELCRNHADEYHVGQHYAIWMEDQGFDWRPHFFKPAGTGETQQKYGWTLPEKYHYNTWITERTCDFLEKYAKNEEKFFHWASFPDPHSPYLVPEPWASMYKPEDVTVPTVVAGEHDKNPEHFRLTQEKAPDYSKYNEADGSSLHGFYTHLVEHDEMAKNIAVYYGMVSYLDDCVGKILDKLEEQNLLDNTLIVFTSDHGHLYGQHGMTTKGAFHYEDLIRVPLLVSCKDQIPSGVQRDDLQTAVDLTPTFLEYAGVEIPCNLSGITRLNNWKTGENPRSFVTVENRHNPYTMNLRTLVTNRYKITLYCASDEGEIFDLLLDPNEINNLWNDPASKELKLELLLKYAQAELAKEPISMPRISIA